MSDCIFCKIANREVPAEIVWENNDFVAFLDISPVTSGMTLLIPKKHTSSYIFNDENEDMGEIMKASKVVAKMLEKTFKVKRIAVIFEGLEVNHLHVKMFPLKEDSSIKGILNSNYSKPTPEDLHKTALDIIKAKSE